MKHSNLLAWAIITAIFFCSCKKDPPPVDNNSAKLNPGRAGISFTTDNDFGNSKAFNVSNTPTTQAVTQPVGSSIRYIVLVAEAPYGGLADIVRTTLMISIPQTGGSVPVIISLIPPGSPSAVPQAQVEMYYTYLGGLFGNTYRSMSGQLTITKITATEIEGNFTATTSGSFAPGFQVSNGKFAGKF